MNLFKYLILAFAVGVTLSSQACTILEFSAENLLSPHQNTTEVAFQEVEAFAAGRFPTTPIFTGTEPRLETGLDRSIDLTGFGYAVVHYDRGTSGNPALNRGGSLVFYYIEGPHSRAFVFPQAGPGNHFSNGLINSVTLFFSVPVADGGATAVLFAIAGGVLLTLRRFAPAFELGRTPTPKKQDSHAVINSLWCPPLRFRRRKSRVMSIRRQR